MESQHSYQPLLTQQQRDRHVVGRFTRTSVAAGKVCLWCSAWWALMQVATRQRCAPYAAISSIAIHLRVAAPLGQLLPLPDPFLGYFFSHSWLLCIVFAWFARNAR